MHVNFGKKNTFDSTERLKEIVNLAKNLNIKVLEKRIVNLSKINPSTLIGKGTINQLRDSIFNSKINLLIFNCSLTPAQQKNLENSFQTKVTDRPGIIIEIFAKRAISNEGKLQVELAELIYRKSRLVRAWTHLERQRGGTTFIGGPGELQIELDRRLIQNKIERIKKRLSLVSKRRALQRQSRNKNEFKTFALVGYTNSGKTALFNRLTKSNKSSEDKLFVTLDTKISKVFLGNSIFAGLIDTVGFIADIPTQLIESFKATLEEVNKADFLLNVVDINDHNYKSKIDITKNILKDVGVCQEKISSMITVYNKIDVPNIEYVNKDNKTYVSARTGQGLGMLINILKNII